ncbi:uncharacterized protein HMPREF1541_07906 [Cyphellophora europaea CBS 101466]|uniref:CCR4-Not complex 3'-5'-exoribonuclease subunit Ccr4 n=1 Tax=Cyphellophora europaea (strain CBS 101466) TaxID=1220924 RepID=W2RMH8_CYPE1|nr:uncharacterized protein HMPREF1541_07906 [Cyphellophora europaea CBS 101466]ETN36919.1 hypothetical protein HMPREF1541_07906 [Cyphellophora europaea CBS 101466]
MADGPLRYQQPAPNLFYNAHSPRNASRTNSPRNPRRHFAEFPSPTASPLHAIASHGPTMFHNAYQNHNNMMNGAQSHQRFGNMQVHKQHQQHYGPHGPMGHHQHQHGPMHQHNISGGFSNAQHHVLGFQDQMQNGGGDASPDDIEDMDNDYWKEQQSCLQECREMHGPNQRAKNVAHNAKGISYIGADDPNSDRAKKAGTTTGSRSDWDELDLGGQGLHALSPILFNAYGFIRRLNLGWNNLTVLSPTIGQLKQLEHLDVSFNQLSELPPEIGMLSSLKQLHLFNNRIQTLPYEVGFLFKLEMLGIAGNPLESGQKDKITEGGTKALVHHLRESMPEPPPPRERVWHQLDESAEESTDSVKALSYNILCERYATPTMYGYVPERVLSWAYRKTLILDEIREQNADIVCLQELDKNSYDEWFRGKLAEVGYKGYFAQKSRAETLGENARFVDGCGTFWKDKKYIQLHADHLVLGRKAVERPGAKASADMLNRVWQRDDIATVVFLENRVTGSRIIVVNSHIFWDPAFKDVKLIQAAVMMEEVSKLAERYAKWPAVTNKQTFRFADADDSAEPPPEMGPSLEYTSPAQIPMILCGDWNSGADSAVYDLFTKKGLTAQHDDLAGRDYGTFSKNGMSHEFSLKSAYSGIEDEMPFTNYTPSFAGVLDHIWFSTNSLRVTGLLGEIDPEYLKRVPGFPNFHFPSDHLALVAGFRVEKRRKIEKVDADFGPSSRK